MLAEKVLEVSPIHSDREAGAPLRVPETEDECQRCTGHYPVLCAV